MILKPPFDDLGDLTKAIELYKSGLTMQQVADAFLVSIDRVRSALQFAGVEIRKKGIKIEITKIQSVGKYDSIIDEPINPGHSYAYLLEKYGLKVFSGAIQLKSLKKTPLDKRGGEEV